MEDELAALAALVGGGERNLDAELVRRLSFSFTDTLGFRGVPRRKRTVAPVARRKPPERASSRAGAASGCGFARPGQAVPNRSGGLRGLRPRSTLTIRQAVGMFQKEHADHEAHRLRRAALVGKAF